ncbi:MAG TPA: transglutaminase domain-containing protein [Planctomycetota bacterium]|nr:transglutaminase domain-containing protein [Planctomycetota bacterium]
MRSKKESVQVTGIPEELVPYAGREPRIDDPVQRIGYALSVAGSSATYKEGTFDHHQKGNQIVLNEETAGFIYRDFTPLEVAYAPQSRPQLERLVNRLCPDGLSDREKVLALVDHVYRGAARENVDIFSGRKLFVLNAREEEVLKLNRCSCECNTRVIVCLAQIAGFPARYTSSYSFADPEKDYALNGGHAMPEIYLEGGWALFDSDHGFFCLKEDGKIASLWELRQDPSLVERQPEWVYNSFGRTRKAHLGFRATFLSPHSVMSVTNYSVNDHKDYDWNWILIPGDREDPRRKALTRERESLRKKLVGELVGNQGQT